MKKNIISIIVFILLIISGCAEDKNVRELGESLISKYGLKSSFVKVNNVEIHYVELGKGYPVILVHGWMGWGTYWRNIIPALSKRYHVYAIDLIGHGLSEKPLEDNKYTTDAQARMIKDLMKKLSIDKAIILGHSMGGEISAKIAIMYPDMVKKLILMGALGMSQNVKKLPFLLKTAMTLPGKSFIAGLSSKFFIRYFLRNYGFYSGNPVGEDLIDNMFLVNFCNKEGRVAFQKIADNGLFRDSVEDKISTISSPTLLIWGDSDLLSPLDCGKQYEKLIPESRLVVLEKTGHMVFHERPKEIEKLVLDFL